MHQATKGLAMNDPVSVTLEIRSIGASVTVVTAFLQATAGVLR
jgi:hypothetical protein